MSPSRFSHTGARVQDISHRDNQTDISQILCGNMARLVPRGGLAASLSWELEFNRMDVATWPKRNPGTVIIYLIFLRMLPPIFLALPQAAKEFLGKSCRLNVSLQSFQGGGCFSGGGTIPFYPLLTII